MGFNSKKIKSSSKEENKTLQNGAENQESLNNNDEGSLKQNKGSSKQKYGVPQKTKKSLFSIVGTTQESIPYLSVYPELGIIETQKGLYTKCYHLKDMNFRTAQEQTQVSVFEKYQKFLNLFSANNRVQIVINNSNIDEKTVRENVTCKMRGDGLDELRKDNNEIILQRMTEGRNNLTSEKYLIVGEQAKDIKSANVAFSSRLDSTIADQMKQITGSRNANIPPMTIAERLKQLHDLYNIGHETSLPETFDINAYLNQGMSTKDIVAASGISFYRDYFQLNDKFGRVVYLRDLPSIHNTEFVAEISDLPFNLTASIYLEPLEQKQAFSIVRNNMVTINGNVIKAQKIATKSGYGHDMISPELLHAQEQAQLLMDDLRSSNQRLFLATIVIAHYADTKEELDENTQAIIDLGNRYMCAISPLYSQQEEGFNSVLPLAKNELCLDRLMKTETAALFIPFNSEEVNHKGGICYGQNALSKVLVTVNRTDGNVMKNPNGVILGMSGTGKSMLAKHEMLSVLLTRDDTNEVYVLDPDGEYTELANQLNGLGSAVIHLEPGCGVHINPFDMDLNYAADDEGQKDPISLKTDYICMICETANNARFGLTNAEKSIIDRCVRILYKPYMEHMATLGRDVTIDLAATPTLEQFYELLFQQSEPEARNLALSLEIYCTGSFDTFSGTTNVDVNQRFVVYDISNLGSGMRELGLQVCLNHVWNKTIANNKKGITTWFYIDEFHVLTKSETSSNYLVQIWRRCRKHGGVATAITQNVGDLLKTEASLTIINNCALVIMLGQAPLDRELLQNLYHLSNAQLEYITDSPAGQGLIYNGSTIIPFTNRLPKTSKIYQMITTDPNEKKKRQIG